LKQFFVDGGTDTDPGHAISMPQSCYIAVHGHSAPSPSIPIAPEGYRHQGAPEPRGVDRNQRYLPAIFRIASGVGQ
jgi:hypothetical protein